MRSRLKILLPLIFFLTGCDSNYQTQDEAHNESTSLELIGTEGDLLFGSAESYSSITLEGDASWQATQDSSSEEWLYLSSYCAEGGCDIDLLILANNTLESRIATITITSNDTQQLLVTLTQYASEEYIEIDKYSVLLGREGGSSSTLNIISSCDWQIEESYAEWLQVQQTGDKIILQSCEENLSDQRSTTLELSYEGKVLSSIQITQDGVVELTLETIGEQNIPDENCWIFNTVQIADISELSALKEAMQSVSSRNLEIIFSQLTTMPKEAFLNYENGSFNKVSLPQVTSIEESAFSGCTSLAYIDFPNVETIGKEAFLSCEGLLGDLVIPNSVTSIGQSAFKKSCYNGTLYLSSQLTTIESATFSGCKFSGTLTLPEGLTILRSSAFWNCYGFTGTLTLPQSIELIEDNTFTNSIFDSIVCYAETPPILNSESWIANNSSAITDIRVPAESVDLYKSAAVWSSYSKNISAIR